MGVVARRPEPLAMSERDAAVFVRAALQPGRLTSMLAYYRQLGALTADDFAAAAADARRRGRVRAPALVLWGDSDGALGPELARGHARLYESVREVVIRRCSHWVQQDAVRECLREVGAFLGVEPDFAALVETQ